MKIKIKGIDEYIKYDKVNGIDLYYYNNNIGNTFMVSITVKAGADNVKFKYNNKNYEVRKGCAHFLEHILCETNNRKVLLSELKKYGALSNAATYSDRTTFYFYGTDNFKECLNILMDTVLNHKFDKEYFEKERGPILSEARMVLDDVDRVSILEMYKMLYHKLPNHKSGVGDVSDIKKITLDELKLFYKAFYNKDNIFITVAGNLDYNEVLKSVKANLDKYNLKGSKVIKYHYDEDESVVENYKEIKLNVDIPKALICYKIPRKLIKEEDFLKFNMVISMLLSSNFSSTSEFREKLLNEKLIHRLTYYSDSEEDYIEIGFEIYSKNIKKVIPIIKDKFNNLDVSYDDINRKRKSWISNIVRDYDNALYILDNINYEILKYGKVIDNNKIILDNITLDDINYYKEFLKTNDSSTLVIYPKEKSVN